jgi:hypothetical protein
MAKISMLLSELHVQQAPNIPPMVFNPFAVVTYFRWWMSYAGHDLLPTLRYWHRRNNILLVGMLLTDRRGMLFEWKLVYQLRGVVRPAAGPA